MRMRIGSVSTMMTAAAMAVVLLAGGVRAEGLRGNYGFLTSTYMGEQPEAEARARVDVMARSFGVREFQFYDWFADYSTPVRGADWTDPYFRRAPISRRTIEVYIDEIHHQGGRAWAYVQSVGAEETDLENPAHDIWKLKDAAGNWHWHPPGVEHPRFPTYFANGAWARHQVARWAGPIRDLGFDGIHWDTLGRIAPEYGAETGGIHAFLREAKKLLEPRGLRQTMNFVDLSWWDRKVVAECVEFPYVEAWSHETANRYFAEMDADPVLAGRRGVFAMYPYVGVPAGWTESEVLRDRWVRAKQHHLVYLLVGDGARRMKAEWWPDTVPLTEGESEFLRSHR